MNSQRLSARRAIEALRSGVPSPAAVMQLGTTQHDLAGRFSDALQAVAEGRGASPVVMEADFGRGKSHLLQYLASIASEQGFVTSYVTVSPETPLGNAQVMLRAIAESARAPGREGRALRAMTSELRRDGPEIGALRDWARSSDVDERFRALLHLYEGLWADEELRLQILADIEGRPLAKSVIRQKLKELGQLATYDLKGTPRSALLSHDRLRVFARSCRACTGRGLLVLFDEVERLCQFTAKQRLPAYAELGWWDDLCQSEDGAVVAVLAMTPALRTERLAEDRQRLGGTIDHGTDAFDRLGLRGIDMLEGARALEPTTPEQRATIRYRVRSIYQEAYGCELPDLAEGPELASTSIREEIRKWVTRWDLYRHDPGYVPQITEDAIRFDASEIPDDITAADDDGGAGAA